MGHVLGIGTLWNWHGLAPNTKNQNGQCPYIYNSKASQEWRAISQCNSAAPVEDSTGRQGSDCGHWDDACFKEERMTYNGGNKISRVTVGSLEDIGYDVNYNAADSYTYADLGNGAGCKCGNRRLRGNSENASFLVAMEAEPVEAKRPRRRLSDAGHARAWSFGESILVQRRAEAQMQGLAYGYGAGERGSADNYEDVGSKVVMVLYEENGEEYGVKVTM